MYNIVGFQTHLKWGEQKRVFGMIPGLAGAEFVRYGVMHRNTYIHSPDLLEATMEARARKGLFFAGQMTGVEGYVESAASGIVAAYSAFARAAGKEPRMKKNKEEAPTIEDEARRFLANVNQDLENGSACDGECGPLPRSCAYA